LSILGHLDLLIVVVISSGNKCMPNWPHHKAVKTD